ncbi:hypothetical protein FRC00_012127 [Tulasnella sp. 408]|nr:hypothetical protein FRC00_012127 [Tulasnella sp. 408]
MFHHRIDPTRITVKEGAQAVAHGGQGEVIVGTLTSREPFERIRPAAVEMLFSSICESAYIEGLEKELVEQRKEALYQQLKEWPEDSELRKLVSEEIGDLPREQEVAIKKLEWPRDDPEDSAMFFKSFVNELSLMAPLFHPNIIEFLGFVEDTEKGDAWIILPWVANGNVRDFLKSGEWDIPERVSLVQDTAAGLEYLHTHDPPICHGDLKSLNILVNSSYRAIITDFGSARLRREVESETRSETSFPMPINDGSTQSTSPQARFNASTLELTLTGPGFSLRWTAPEVLLDEMQDLPSDMWALGWICWEIVTGRMPFEGVDNEAMIIMHTLQGQLPAIRKDAQLAHVLMLCALMSDCWFLLPAQRIDASTFRRKVGMVTSTNNSLMNFWKPSDTPSPVNPENQKARSARLHIKLGNMYSNQNDMVKAESHYREAIKVATETEDQIALAIALHYLGDWCRRRSEVGEAECLYQQAHEIHSRLGNDLDAANALDGLGETYGTQSKNQEAEKAFNAAHEIHSRIGNDLGAANALLGLGVTYGAQSKNQEAEKAFNAAHEIHSRIGNDLGAATALDGLGETYCVQSKNQEAEKAFNAAHEIHSRIGDDLGAATALLGLGDTYRARSQYREAEGAFNHARATYSSLANHLGAGNAFRSLGLLYSDQCRYSEAELSYHQAVASYARINNSDDSAKTLLLLGEMFHTRHRYLEAEEAVTEALATWTSTDQQEGQASAWLLLSQIFRSQSKDDEEMDSLIQAAAALTRTGDHPVRAATLDRMGDVQLAWGNYTEAEEYYHLAQAIYLSTDNTRGGVTELFRLGRLYLHQRRYGEAEECFTQARRLCAVIFDEEGEARALDYLTGALALQFKLGDAKVACKEACEIYTRMDRPMSEMCARTWQFLQNLE